MGPEVAAGVAKRLALRAALPKLPTAISAREMLFKQIAPRYSRRNVRGMTQILMNAEVKFYQVSGCGSLSLFQRLRAKSVASIHFAPFASSTCPSQNATFARP